MPMPSPRWLLGVLLLLFGSPVRAACNPESCDGFFACGVRECVANACLSFTEEAGTPCRVAAGTCDAAESCNGTSLSCPTDRKRSASAVCRQPSSPCDTPERCDGSSNECPADTGSAPAVSAVTFLAVDLHDGGSVIDHDVTIEVIGSNLCNARIQMPDLSERSLEPAGDGRLPSHRLSLVASYATPEARAGDFSDGSYPIEINSGEVLAALVFEAGAPAAAVDIVAPEEGAVVGSQPAFTLVNHCADCTLMRLVVVALDAENRFIGDSFFDAWPVDAPFVRDLDHILPGTVLGEGAYELHAETLDGSFQLGSFPPTVIEFEYVSGTVFRDELSFTVPEPASGASQAIVVGPLAWRAARRRRERSARFDPTGGSDARPAR
jgi:hypothetical protein